MNFKGLLVAAFFLIFYDHHSQLITVMHSTFWIYFQLKMLQFIRVTREKVWFISKETFVGVEDSLYDSSDRIEKNECDFKIKAEHIQACEMKNFWFVTPKMLRNYFLLIAYLENSTYHETQFGVFFALCLLFKLKFCLLDLFSAKV